MLKPKTNRQVILIVNNVVRACADITKLNKTGYNYLYLASGFIAHYNLHGFRDFYSCPGKLRRWILDMRDSNQWGNFHHGQEHYDYYRQKAEIYNRICVAISV